MKIVFATENLHKLQEIKSIAESFGFNADFVLPNKDFKPIENGRTFEENSLIKANEAYRVSNEYCLADDSGLCVEALDGAPGLYSARYAGSQDEKIEKLLKELEGVKDRKAQFVCCMTLLDNKGNLIFQTSGKCHGSIVTERKGVNGFGYDPIFLVDGYSKTMAELTSQEKNKISHRAVALKEVIDFLNSVNQINIP